VFLDIGANEGFFSALAGRCVGPQGLVLAVEPQRRLRDVIELNLRLNDVRRFRVYRNAFGGADGTAGRIHLYPSLNSGVASIGRRYRLARRADDFTFVDLARIMQDCSIGKVDFVKVDVEGFEHRVVRSLLPHLTAGVIGGLHIDFHAPLLRAAGIEPTDVHQSILDEGYQVALGDAQHLNSYLLYERADATSAGAGAASGDAGGRQSSR
jgi:FkbM family methyltransferase